MTKANKPDGKGSVRRTLRAVRDLVRENREWERLFSPEGVHHVTGDEAARIIEDIKKHGPMGKER